MLSTFIYFSIIDLANKTLEEAKGHVIFITDNSRCSIDLKHQVRFVDVTGFALQGAAGLQGFIKGIVAANGDNEYIFIDGIARIAKAELKELGDIFAAMEKLEADFGVKFVVTCSAAKEDLPDFILKCVD